MTIPNLAGLEIAVEIEAEGWRAIGDDIAGLVAHAVRAALARRGAGAGGGAGDPARGW